MQARPRFPETQYSYYAMKGGLDLVTPAIEMDPGHCIDSLNYEPTAVGGYRRINGYERYDGHPSPTAAGYWVLSANITGTIAVGNTLTGLTSGASGKVLGIYATTIVLGRVTGTYLRNESLQVGGVTQAVATTGSTKGGAGTASDDADYRLLAANDLRADILAVPGSGPIRGVWVYNDIRYAFRDNAGGTAGDMYKSTASGWSKITFGTEIQFTGAVGQISDGQVVTGLTSGASATVVRALLRTGTWTVSGVGTLVLSGVTGTFQNGEALQVGGVTKATSSSLATAITRVPGGHLEIVNANFTGSTSTLRMYGVDGVNLAFEFDGTNYVPIRTGMTTDTPKHVAEHKKHLFLTFLGALQYSGIGAPYSYTLLTGANEIGMGSEITILLPQTGDVAGSSMAVCTKENTSILYGSSSADFALQTSNVNDLGFAAYTAQRVGNNSYGLTARGVQSLLTTLNYGDFNYAAISFLIQPLLDLKVGLETASTTLKGKNQYRLYFSDNTAIVIGLTGDKVSGIMPLDYGMPVRCMCTAKLSTGEEVTYFGSDNGYVYQDNTGTSFDGAVIDSWIRPAFNNLQSPRVRKQFRRAAFEVKCDGYASVNISYDIGYATPDVTPAALGADQAITGAGNYWDQFIWEQFTWDAAVVSDAEISIDGTERNISFLFRSKRAQDDPHTIGGVNLLYTPRRLVR